jgi:hypothetical protein
MTSREEIVDWKHHPVTMEFFEAIKERISDLRIEITENARYGDPRDLSFRAGAVQALLDILDVDF